MTREGPVGALPAARPPCEPGVAQPQQVGTSRPWTATWKMTVNQMNFWQFLENKDHDVQALTEPLVQRCADLLARGHSIADLLFHYGEEFGHLPAERLRSLSRAHRAWQVWRRRKQRLDEARRKAKLEPLPETALGRATTPDELDAVARTARICNSSDVGGTEAWTDLLCAGLELWRACVRLTRKEGSLVCGAKDLDHPEASHYDAYLRTSHELGSVAPHRWLAMRRGARQGVLDLRLELPGDALAQQAALYRPRLAVGPSAERSAGSLLEELVLNDLEPWLFNIVDGDVEAQAIQAACESLDGLVRAAPLQARRVGSLFVGSNNAAAAIVVDREGELSAQRLLKAEGNWVAKALELFEQHKVHHVIFPAGSTPGSPLAEAEQPVVDAGLQIQRVRSAALAEARLPLTNPPRRLSGSVASALILAQRATDPIKAWSSIDPFSIGVAEYQNDLDRDRLRAALTETLELRRLERRRGKPAVAAASASRGGAAMAARLNPLVRSVSDLRAGMTVHGVVTNVSHFGAFVSIGLQQDALVHISELSDDYVANPNEVVSIGQQVSAHILSVDPARGRISLTMKTHRRAPEAGRRANGGGQARAGGGRPRPPNRTEALASLERLFKK